MYLIVGLGNPASEYAGTRHNVGFDCIDELARRLKCTAFKSKFRAEYAECRIGTERVFLVKPQTFMNLSGQSVGMFRTFFKIEPARIIVMYDDMDLPIGALRIRAKGSAGTHNGMKSVVQCVGTEEFPRIRVGIGKDSHGDVVDFVLGRFSKEDRQLVDAAIAKAADAALDIMEHDINHAMNNYNK